MQHICACHKINVRIAHFHIVHAVILRDHAPPKTDEKIGIFLFECLEGSRSRKCTKLGVLSYCAGVVNNKVGVFKGVGGGVAHKHRLPHKPFAVGFVLLTAEGVDKDLRAFTRIHRFHTLGVFLLQRKYFAVSFYLLCHFVLSLFR